MKYIRYKNYEDKEFVGILEDDNIYRLDFSSIIEAINHEDEFLKTYKNNMIDSLSEVTISIPVDASKIICVGLNYADHANELEMTLPTEPLLFMKPSTSMIASNDKIIYPDSTQKLDFEAELGIVILSKNTDNTYNYAYTIINDVTARDLQEKDGQWTRAKSFDTFCPVGPVVITNYDIKDKKIYSKVNGQLKQNSNINNMIFTPEQLVKYVSEIMTLNPGDLIATGTPPGIDHLNKGDTITIGIEDIGILKNIVE